MMSTQNQQSNTEQATSTVLEEVLEETNSTAEEKTVASDIDLDTFHARIAELEEQVKEAKDAHARANAEAYNARNRMEQETEKAKKFALQKFVKEMLEVVDNLERAIENTPEDNVLLEGVKLTHKSLLTVLERQGVQVVNPLGEKFNADLHEAVGIDPDADSEMVGQVLQKGYTLHERLIRPAMVRVGQ